MQTYLALVALIVICACKSKAPASVVNDSLEIIAPSTDDSLGLLIQTLDTITGQYHKGASGQWVFYGNTQVFKAIAGFGDSAVVRLTDCLGDTRPSSIMVEGRSVLIGVLCYEALLHTAYAEPEGSESGEWPGVLLPNATSSDLNEARTAWQEVVRLKGYRLN